MSKKILIAEDNVNAQSSLKDILEEFGFDVVVSSDGQESLEKAQLEKPDLILMDVMMPNMSGGDAVRVLKNKPETQNIPVIFLTGMLGAGTQQAQGINIGGELYPSIGKPVNTKALIEMIQKYVR